MDIMENAAFWNDNRNYIKLNSVQKVFGLQDNNEDKVTCDCGGTGGCADSGCGLASCSSCASAE